VDDEHRDLRPVLRGVEDLLHLDDRRSTGTFGRSHELDLLRREVDVVDAGGLVERGEGEERLGPVLGGREERRPDAREGSSPRASVESVELDAGRGVLQEADDEDAAGEGDAADRDVLPLGDERLPAGAAGGVQVDGDDAAVLGAVGRVEEEGVAEDRAARGASEPTMTSVFTNSPVRK
jgi:hypothetical protein